MPIIESDFRAARLYFLCFQHMIKEGLNVNDHPTLDNKNIDVIINPSCPSDVIEATLSLSLCWRNEYRYTYFKKGYRGDRRMVNPERQLNDQKDSCVFEISHQTKSERSSHASTNVYRAHVSNL